VLTSEANKSSAHVGLDEDHGQKCDNHGRLFK